MTPLDLPTGRPLGEPPAFFWIEQLPGAELRSPVICQTLPCISFVEVVVKQISGMAMTALLAIMLAACAGGGAEGGGSSITTYGTVDVGVSHTSK